ncbi:hypothetical protein F5148DRAFT_1374262 [Russula earlei]|uniref:Uncharacterized protein n=1 Tax=Russula earlei TaxID=71964 RepID=A0ACC0UHR0_9AGAM|nr:hypothetical protein F5148DRAFT_1374262 [Russula earlei]
MICNGYLLIVSQPFPPGHNGGQTFTSTLLLSFLCARLLKQHILHTLSMTNEELASLELIIAQAWDQWDHQLLSHLKPPQFQLRPPPCHLSFWPSHRPSFAPHYHSFTLSTHTLADCRLLLVAHCRPLSPHAIVAPTSLAPTSIVVPAPSSTSSTPYPVTPGSASLTAVTPAPFHVSVLVSPSATVSASAATVVLVSRDTSIAAPLLSKEIKKVQTRAKPGAATEEQTLPPHRQPRRRR